MRCAYDLTEPAKKAEGKSNRRIAKETGVPHTTVDAL
jgi:hypothetical protein